jgi:dihydroorotase-like cyclic amidohydrolase
MVSAELLAQKKSALVGVSRVDYAPYGTLTHESVSALPEMVGHVPAVKCFLGGSTGAAGVKDEASLRLLFQAASKANLKVVAHCEDNSIMREVKAAAPPEMATRHDFMRPIRAEVESIRTALRVAAEFETDLHVFHVSTARGAQLIAQAAAAGQKVAGSVGPQYLLVDADEAHEMAQNRFKINPSIKDSAQREGLRQAVASGALAMIGTDHAPHPLGDKDRPYAKAASGFPSIDLLLPLLFAIHDEAGLSLEVLLAAATSAPAKEFGLAQKGQLQPGFDADLVLVDPSPSAARTVDESQLPSRSKWSPFHGRVLRAWPEQVWLRGQLAFSNGAVVGEPQGRPLFD